MRRCRGGVLAAAVTLLALAPASAAWAATLHASLQPGAVTVNPGDIVTIELAVANDGVPFNAFDASVRFDPARLAFVTQVNSSIQRGELMTNACSNTFHRFSAASDSLQITLSLLCNGVSVIGPGVVYRVQFQAGSLLGLTHLGLGPSTRFYDAGFFVSPLDTAGMTICIGNCATGVGSGIPPASVLSLSAPRPNPWSALAPLWFTVTQPSAGPVTLTLHDISGRVWRRSASEWLPAGSSTLSIEHGALPNGLYFARFSTRAGVVTRSVVVVR